MENILERAELRTPALTKFVRETTNDVHQTANYMGPAILQMETINGLEWKIIKRKRGIPVMANIHAMNAESGIGQRQGEVTFREGEIPSLKRKIDLGPKTLFRLKTTKYVTLEWQQLIDEIYDDLGTLRDSVLARVEWLRWQALAKGAFSYSEEDVRLSVDFLMPALNKASMVTDTDRGFGGIAWDEVGPDTPCDWVQDLLVYVKWYKLTYGQAPTRAVCSTTVLDWMKRNVAVGEKYLWGSDFAERIMAADEFAALLARYELPSFVTYDVQVQSEDVDAGTLVAERLLPEYRVVLLPPAGVRVGGTLFAPTVEALMNSEQLIGQPAPGLYAESWIEGHDTKSLWTKVAANAFPLMDGIDLVGVLTVKTEE